MKLIKRYQWLIMIVIIALGLRLWQLGQIPPSPDWDEAALGYNAYSILKTGRDEYGSWFPLSLRSFDDYKPPLYMYLTVPSIALFGLNIWSVRLPSVIMGVLAVIGVYWLGKQLLKHSSVPGELPAMLLAISPWHLQFSRIAFEANTGVTLNIWGLVAFLHGLKSRCFLAVSAAIFALSFYAYHSERIFVPLLLLSLFLIFRQELLREKRSLLIAVLVGFLTLLPLLPVFFNENTLMRLRGTSALADQTGLLARSVWKLNEDRVAGDPWGQLFDNRRLVWLKTISEGYLSHYSLRWLFLTGDNPRHHAPDVGLMYLWELPVILVGIYSLFKIGGQTARLLFAWLIIAPVAAAPTTELPHAIRAIVFLPAPQLVTAVGIMALINFGKKLKEIKWLAAIIAGFFIIFNFIYYLEMYLGHSNQEYSKFWQYGYEQAVNYALLHKKDYFKIVVSTKLEQPHMFFLFFTRYDPATYLREGGTASGGFAEIENKFDRFEFRPINWGQEIKDGTILYIGTPQEIPLANRMTIYYLDRTEAMRIADR